MKKTAIVAGSVIVVGALLLNTHPKALKSIPSPSPTPTEEVSLNTKLSTEVNGVKMFNGKPVKFCFDHSKC